MQSNEKILLVDDESRVLMALRRSLRSDFNVEVADGAVSGLEAIRDRGPFAVVVSDLQMPGMDGVEFLSQVKAIAPHTVRIMLSGHADLSAAIAAVNEGSVFRFLTKPCSAAELAQTLAAAIEMYRLVIAERELLQRTLMGSITVLTEILALAYPAAFRRSLRIKWYVRLMGLAARLPDLWQFEAAAMLSQIGCIALPLGTANKVHAGAALSHDESRLFAHHPATAKLFLRNIPRLEPVAEMIAAQQKPYSAFVQDVSGAGSHVVALGAQMLHIAIELERSSSEGASFVEAVALMIARPEEFNPELLRVLAETGEPMSEWRRATVSIGELGTAMVADEDIRAMNGLVLLSKGDQVTLPTLERVRCFAAEMGVAEPIQVLLQQSPAMFEAPGQPASAL